MVGQVRYKYTNINETPDIFSDILKNGVISEGTTIIKLAIQAPFGTRIKIDDKDIVIGYTRIYVLPDDITVKSLYFINDNNLKQVLIDYVVE